MGILDIELESRTGNTFTAYIDYEAVSGTSEVPHLLFRNPSGSEKRVYVTHFAFGHDSTVTRSMFKIYKDPTITTEGTVLTKVNLAAIDSAPNAVATVFKNPTISANGTLMSSKLMSKESSSDGQNRSIVVSAGHEILITVKNDITGILTLSQIYWVEV